MIPDPAVAYSLQNVAQQLNVPSTEARLRRVATAVVLSAFSLFYFADVLLRASEKYFWYDELISVYLCRFSFASLWQTLLAGIDSNPPLFYVLTKASNAIFGEGLIGTRMPEILGFWIFCLCLFRFVNKRTGVLGGVIAMLFPVFTGAFYYAFEARPHGIVLGFCGLALVFWQMSSEHPDRKRWLLCYALSLLAAFLTHCYAIIIAFPFALAELAHDIRARRFNLQRWLAIILPAIVACLTYLPLLSGFRELGKGERSGALSPLIWPEVHDFYSSLLGPCMLILVIVVALLAVRCMQAVNGTSEPLLPLSIPVPEIVAALSFAAAPALGMVIAKVTHSPAFYRYFLSASVAICILTGLAAAVGKPLNWIAVAIAAVLVCSAGWNISSLFWHRLHGVPENLVEPASGFSMNSSLAGPLDRYTLLLSEARAHKDQPIAIMSPFDYLYLVNYAPQLIDQIYYVKWSDHDFNYRGQEVFERWSQIHYKMATEQEFLRLSPNFMMYGQSSELAYNMTRNPNIKITRLKTSNDHFLAEAQNEEARQ